MRLMTGNTPDPKALAEIHALCFPHAPWTAQALEDLMQNPGTLCIVTPDQTGFIVVSLAKPEADILTLAVHPDYRRRGQAEALLQSLTEACTSHRIKEIFLEVGAQNHAARALYAKAGFEEVGLRKAYYAKQDGTREDAVILKRTIAQ